MNWLKLLAGLIVASPFLLGDPSFVAASEKRTTPLKSSQLMKSVRDDVVSNDRYRASSVEHLSLGVADVSFQRIGEGDPKTVLWRYRDAGRPVPVAEGMVVWLGLGKQGEVRYFRFDATVHAWRRGDGGRIELICKADNTQTGGTKSLLHLGPDWLEDGLTAQDAQVSVPYFWSKQFGFGPCVQERGGDGRVIEGVASKTRGILVDNHPGFEFQFGRDGWRNILVASLPQEQFPKGQRLSDD